MLKLIRNVDVYAPEPLGRRSIFICGERIVAFCTPAAEDQYTALPGLQVLEGAGLTALPGLIDQHVHIIGGGGEDGFASSIGALEPESCVENGVTTVVGVLGTDSAAKSVRQLVAYTKKLRSAGLTAYCLTGSYAFPPPTVTGNVQDDIVYISEVLGVKLAISDHRSSYPTRQELLRLAAQARVAGMLSGKPGYVHLHVGSDPAGLKDLLAIVREDGFPIATLRPTHVDNCLEDAETFAALGGYIDFTSGKGPEEQAAIVAQLLHRIPKARVTVSSDANGSMPLWGSDAVLLGMGRSSLASDWKMLRALVEREGLPLEQALPLFTSNVAEALGFGAACGRLAPGGRADILLMDGSWRIRDVLVRGQRLLADGVSCVPSYYRQA